jgi:hypothetical protein
MMLISLDETEVLGELEDDFDPDTRWAIAWFEQNGFGPGDFGDAEVLSKAKVTSIAGLRQAGVIASKAGKVRLLLPNELATDWDPAVNGRLSRTAEQPNDDAGEHGDYQQKCIKALLPVAGVPGKVNPDHRDCEQPWNHGEPATCPVQHLSQPRRHGDGPLAEKRIYRRSVTSPAFRGSSYCPRRQSPACR